MIGQGKRGLTVLALGLLGMLFPAAAVAEDAQELLRERDGARASSTISLNYREVTLERILSDMEKYQAGMNVEVKAETFQEERDLLGTPVTMGPLNGVNWDTALDYIADRMRLVVDRSQAADGVVYLEKVARFTDTFDGVRLGEVVREIAKRGKANVIFSPLVGTDAPVFLSFSDVPWRDALDSVLKAHACTVLHDADGKIMRVTTVAEADIQFETRSRPLRYVQPEGSHFQPEIVMDDHQAFVGRKGTSGTDVGQSLINVLEQIKSEKGNVTYESRTNTLIIRDTPIKIQEMLRIVDEIDVAPQQVHIETRLVTMEENPSTQIGVRWGTDDDGTYNGIRGGMESGSSWSTTFPFAASDNWGNLGNIFRPTNGANLPGGVTPTFGVMSLAELTFMLQMAKYDDSIRVTQAPQILVLDNEEASVFIGSVRNYALAESTVEEGTFSYSYEEKELLVGVQLLVVPHVARGTDQVIIEIIPKQTDEPTINEVNAGGPNVVEIPTRMDVKTVHTKMMLHSTETGVIAGLFANTYNNQERKLPGLSSVPIIGRLFKHNSQSERKMNSMILVTPTIIPPKHAEEFDRDIEAFKESLASSLR